MSIGPGTSLGSYELLAELGAGGMGQVFRAHDTRLGRDVAVKIIHPRLGADADHLARFRREAHTLALLNHPFIAAVHELGEAGGVVFLVMELVPGETLQERLLSGPLGLAEALRICSQVASALEAAHDRGIIHRDLKPANIKITPEGAVKVLDFGLAKELAPTDSASELLQSPTTLELSVGLILGTAAYMSPEQARGRPLDRRTDIWSFGCVLFEALTHRRPFGGETASETIAQILEREPDWSLLPDTTARAIELLLRRCLRKDLQNRLRDIGDARLEIEEVLTGDHSTTTDAPGAGGDLKRRVIRRFVWLALGAALGAALTAGLRRSPPPMRSPAAHFIVSLASAERLAELDFPAVAFSPDGSRVAYVATRGGRPQLFLRMMDRLETTAIDGTADASSPFFSPDQRWLAFFAGGKLKKVPVGGGPSVVVCDAPIGFGGSWGDNDVIVFAPTSGSGLSQVPAAGGTPTRVTTLDTQKNEFSHRWPEVLPGADTVLFTVGTVGSWDDAQIVAQSLTSGRRQLVLQGGTHPHYVPTGHLLYFRGGALMAVPFDVAQLKVTGTPLPVLENVLESFDGAGQASVSRSGSLVYVPGRFESTSRLLMSVDRSGTTSPYSAPPRAYSAPRLSPDGRKLAVTIVAATTEDVWVYDITEGALRQLTFDASNASPVWTPDGASLTFSSNREGASNLFSIRVDGSGTEERLGVSDNLQLPGSWSPDGRTLAYVERSAASGRDIRLLSDAGDRQSRPFLATAANESAPRFSPDGRWVAYVSDESGRNEIYVCPFADPSRKRQVSRDGGGEPVWARSGHELFYRSGDRIVAVPIRSGPDFGAAEGRVLFAGTFEKGTADTANYDVTPDAQRFVMIKANEQDVVPQSLHIILNWLGSALAAAAPRP
jgi:eukaryotic-like serine/threonine-protein kinase